MNRNLFIRPSADSDIDTQFDYLVAEAGLEIGLRFLEAIQTTLETLVRRPQIGSQIDAMSARLRNLRKWHVKGFDNILVFYRHTETSIEIVRVLHSSRNIQAELLTH
jgi:toxin ParE1/3/4